MRHKGGLMMSLTACLLKDTEMIFAQNFFDIRIGVSAFD